jgi:hypothetical protein
MINDFRDKEIYSNKNFDLTIPWCFSQFFSDSSGTRDYLDGKKCNPTPKKSTRNSATIQRSTKEKFP